MDFTGADLKSAANKLGVNGGSENFSKSSKIDHPANSFPLTQNDCDGQVVQYNDNSDEKVYLNGDKKKKKATTSFANLRGSSRLLTCAPSSGIFHMTLIDLLKSLSEDVSLIPILKSFENPLIKSNDTMTNTSAIQKYTMTNFNGVYDEIKQLQLFLFILKVFKQKSPQYFNGEYDGGEKVMLFLPLDAFKNLEALKTNLLEINDNVDVRYPQIFGNGGGYIDGEEFIATLSNVLNNGYNNGSVLSRFGVNICKNVLLIIFIMAQNNRVRDLERRCAMLERQNGQLIQSVRTLTLTNHRQAVKIDRHEAKIDRLEGTIANQAATIERLMGRDQANNPPPFAGAMNQHNVPPPNAQIIEEIPPNIAPQNPQIAQLPFYHVQHAQMIPQYYVQQQPNAMPNEPPPYHVQQQPNEPPQNPIALFQ